MQPCTGIKRRQRVWWSLWFTLHGELWAGVSLKHSNALFSGPLSWFYACCHHVHSLLYVCVCMPCHAYTHRKQPMWQALSHQDCKSATAPHSLFAHAFLRWRFQKADANTYAYYALTNLFETSALDKVPRWIFSSELLALENVSRSPMEEISLFPPLNRIMFRPASKPLSREHLEVLVIVGAMGPLRPDCTQSAPQQLADDVLEGMRSTDGLSAASTCQKMQRAATSVPGRILLPPSWDWESKWFQWWMKG